jgi:O-antigen ligase
MINFCLILFFIFFAVLSFLRFRLSIAFFLLFLPAYLIRFQILGLPTTVIEIMLFVLCAGWLKENWKNLKNKTADLKLAVKNNKFLFTSILLFIISATISVFTSVNLKSAAGEWKAFYIEPIIFSIIIFTTIKNKKDAALILSGLAISGLATCLLGIYQHFTGWMVPWDFWQNRNTYRITGWYGYPNGVGLYIAPILFASLYVWSEFLQKSKIKKCACYIIIILIYFLTAFYAKSTGSIIAMSSGLLVIIFIGFKKIRMPVIALSILSIMIMAFIPATNKIKQELLLQDFSGRLRVDMWGEACQYLSEHVFTGAGLASYKKIIYPYRIDKWIEVFPHPHNIFLTMWMDTGVLGILAFIGIILWFLKNTALHLFQTKNLFQNPLSLYLTGMMISLIVFGLVDSSYAKNDLSIIFWLMMGLVDV